MEFILFHRPKDKTGSSPPTDKVSLWVHRDYLLNFKLRWKSWRKKIIPSLDSAVVVGGLSMILYEPNNFMHVRLNPSLIFYSELTKPNISTTIVGALRAYAALVLLPNIKSPLMEPARWILAARMRAGFPNAPIENGGSFCFRKGDGSWKGRYSSEVCRVVIQLRTVISFCE